MKENQLLKTLKQAKLKLLVGVGSLGWNWFDAAAEAGCKGQIESESNKFLYYILCLRQSNLFFKIEKLHNGRKLAPKNFKTSQIKLTWFWRWLGLLGPCRFGNISKRSPTRIETALKHLPTIISLLVGLKV